MAEPLLQTAWRLEFARKAAISRELEDRLRDEKARRDKREKELADNRRENAEIADLIVAVLASEAEIEAFKVKLDIYDAATVDALMQNEEELTAVRERIQDMLLEAHTLPDGRRVFKTRDGQRVFDEHGTEMKAEEIDPRSIDDRKTRWEDWQEIRAKETALVEERGELLAYQQKLDEARERVDDPELTKNELDALDKEHADAMPERVRRLAGEHAPERETPENERDRTPEPAVQVRPALSRQELDSLSL